MDDVFYRVTKEQDAWLRQMREPPPEPPAHRCGRCNNGTGVYNPGCPNNTRAVSAQEDS